MSPAALLLCALASVPQFQFRPGMLVLVVHGVVRRDIWPPTRTFHSSLVSNLVECPPELPKQIKKRRGDPGLQVTVAGDQSDGLANLRRCGVGTRLPLEFRVRRATDLPSVKLAC